MLVLFSVFSACRFCFRSVFRFTCCLFSKRSPVNFCYRTIFVRLVLLANICSLYFFFLFLARYLSTNIFYHRLVPDLQTLATFCSFVQIQWNQRQNLHILPLFTNNLEYGFDKLKFGFKKICFRTSFDRSLSFVAPIRLILFANQSSSVEFSVWIFSLEFYPWILCLNAYVFYFLFTIEFPECEACYYESLGFSDRQQGK